MQAEVSSFAACCQGLIPVVNMVKDIGNAVGISTSEQTEIHCVFMKTMLVVLSWLRLCPLRVLLQVNIMWLRHTGLERHTLRWMSPFQR